MTAFNEIRTLIASRPEYRAEVQGTELEEVVQWSQSNRNWALFGALILFIGAGIGVYYGVHDHLPGLLACSIPVAALGVVALFLADVLHERNNQKRHKLEPQLEGRFIRTMTTLECLHTSSLSAYIISQQAPGQQVTKFPMTFEGQELSCIALMELTNDISQLGRDKLAYVTTDRAQANLSLSDLADIHKGALRLVNGVAEPAIHAGLSSLITRIEAVLERECGTLGLQKLRAAAHDPSVTLLQLFPIDNVDQAIYTDNNCTIADGDDAVTLPAATEPVA